MSKNQTYKYLVSAKVLKPNSAISNLKTSKEEKKMRKKAKVNGHVVHKLPKSDNLYYTVEPENGRIAVHELIYHVVDWGNNWENNKYEPHYYEYSYIHIYPNKLGKHGYLQERLEAILDEAPVRDYLEREQMFNTFAGALSVRKGDLKALNDTIFEEEKKMRKKAKINGHVLHKLPDCDNLYYTVEPENGHICVHKLAYIDLRNGTHEPHYDFYGRMNIDAKRLGRPGYLAAQVAYLSRKYSGNTTREILSRIADMTPEYVYLEHKKLVAATAAERIYLEHEKLRKDLEKQMRDLDKIRKALDDMTRRLGSTL